MTKRVRYIAKPEPRKDVQNVVRTFELEMKMISKVPKTFYSRAGGVGIRKISSL